MQTLDPIRLPSKLRQLVATLALVLLASAPAGAAPLRFENATEAAGTALVNDAVAGNIDAAFQRAAEMGRPGDATFASDLQHQQQALAAEQETLGAVRSVSTIDASHFGGCVRHEYHVRYADGDQYWVLKWRRGAAGWYLADLAVRSLKV